ncbi:uncharacterized protein LOC120357918 [Solenopsis invicta]|uniref:uncharacterized protein LOC120357918 n=1 Tax=Solenopsis invicta TaxID=13686 RepID=UPI00193D99CF|nr:uncharacterized protein LOC120357918 [Solenopsis invicta]
MWNTNKHTVKLYGPVLQGHQLLGDDILLQIILENSPLPTRKSKDVITLRCGLCVSGLIIENCLSFVKDKNRQILEQVIILLGMADIYNDATFEKMTEDMLTLLDVLPIFLFLNNA